jgi:hypothetical protein
LRVRVDIPALLPELCEFLESRGYDVVQNGGEEIHVAWPQEPEDFRAAVTLLADLDLWRARHPWVQARLDPELTR